MKNRPFAISLLLLAPVVWAFYQLIVISDPTSRTIYVLVITAFLPQAILFLQQSGAITDLREDTIRNGAKFYPCEFCTTLFKAAPFDDVHTIASRTKGDYSDQKALKYACRKCKRENIIYWSHYG
ncbi:MAG TPA: hypothetical protein VJZ75_02390 [Candidatus Bathyarchaeia archaeon]|nr:hypothetical protein [Candidatus Bathyarchaeia archaeon]